MDKLSPAGKQLVEICRAIQHGSSLLIFDEPTSSLSERRNAGGLPHRPHAARAQDGRDLHHAPAGRTARRSAIASRCCATARRCISGALREISRPSSIIQHMVGREVAAIYQRDAVPPGEELLRVENLTREGRCCTTSSFTLRAGEIVGMAGLIGAGRTELCRAIFGVDPIDSREHRDERASRCAFARRARR